MVPLNAEGKRTLINRIDRLLEAAEAYAIAIVREATSITVANQPASYRQQTVEARVRLIAAIGEMDNDK